MFNPNAAALDLDRSQQRAQRAEKAFNNDKQGARSAWAEIQDALSNTPIEIERDQAQRSLSDCIDSIVALAPEWVENQIAQAIAASLTPESKVLLQSRPSLVQEAKRHARLRHLGDITLAAHAALKSAAAQCDAASTGELLDVMSTTPRSSALFGMETSEADYAVNKAKTALRYLSDEIESLQAMGVDEEVVGWRDIVLDFDVTDLSVLNVSALDNSQKTCEHMAQNVHPLMQRIATLVDQGAKKMKRAQDAYVVLEKPFRASVMEALPESIRELLNQRGLVAAPNLLKPESRRTRLIDLDILKKVRA